MQKREAIAGTEIQIEQAKSQFEINKLMQEAELKKQLMAEEFNYQIQLSKLKADAEGSKLAKIEDRKDERTKIQATQQSELIEQRKNNSLPKNFESSGYDVMGGGFDLGQFEPS